MAFRWTLAWTEERISSEDNAKKKQLESEKDQDRRPLGSKQRHLSLSLRGRPFLLPAWRSDLVLWRRLMSLQIRCPFTGDLGLRFNSGLEGSILTEPLVSWNWNLMASTLAGSCCWATVPTLSTGT